MVIDFDKVVATVKYVLDERVNCDTFFFARSRSTLFCGKFKKVGWGISVG